MDTQTSYLDLDSHVHVAAVAAVVVVGHVLPCCRWFANWIEKEETAFVPTHEGPSDRPCHENVDPDAKACGQRCPVEINDIWFTRIYNWLPSWKKWYQEGKQLHFEFSKDNSFPNFTCASKTGTADARKCVWNLTLCQQYIETPLQKNETTTIEVRYSHANNERLRMFQNVLYFVVFCLSIVHAYFEVTPSLTIAQN